MVALCISNHYKICNVYLCITQILVKESYYKNIKYKCFIYYANIFRKKTYYKKKQCLLKTLVYLFK